MSSHSRSLSTQPLLSLLGIKSEPWTPLPTSEKEAADQTKLGNAPSWYRQRAGEWPTLRSSGTRTGRSVILLAVVLALLLAHASRTARRPILRPSTVQRDDALTFDEFLRRHFDPASTVPFLILVDGEYAPMARAAELRMHELNLIEGAPTRPVSSSSTNETALSARSSSGRVKHPLVVLCSDEVCLDYATSRGMYAYGGYAVSTVPGGGRTGSVTEQEVVSRKGLMPWIKFSALRDVTQAGWNTVWTEGDVFLHGDPFKYMLRLEGEPRWDVQIAWDGMHRANFGWMYTKATSEAAAFWARCFDRFVPQPGRWDQEIVHDELGPPMKEKTDESGGEWFVSEDEEEKLRVYVLPFSQFKGWHRMQWPEGPRPVMEHLTAVWSPLRPFVAKEMGWYPNVDGYYTTPPASLLGSSILTGSIREVTQAARLLMVLGRLTNRTVIPPEGVYSESHHRKFIRTFPVGLLSQHAPMVESNYWRNAKPYMASDVFESRARPLRFSLADYKTVFDLIQAVRHMRPSTPERDAWRYLELTDWRESNYMVWELEELVPTSPLGRFEPCDSWIHDEGIPRYWCRANPDGTSFEG